MATTEGCPAVVAHSVFVGNGVRRDGGAAAGSGTALHLNRYGTSNYNISDCSITLYNNTFIGNLAQEWGGAVWIWGWQRMDVNITQNVFARNRLVSSSVDTACGGGMSGGWARGGAMVLDPDEGSVVLSRNLWAANHACVLGGALYAASSQGVLIDSDVYERNSADGGMGGAVVLRGQDSSMSSLNNVRFVSNSAQRGGALFVDGSTIDITDTAFMDNMAAVSGGGLLCDRCRNVQLTRWGAAGIPCKRPIIVHNPHECVIAMRGRVEGRMRWIVALPGRD
jgi:hypothetical protein